MANDPIRLRAEPTRLRATFTPASDIREGDKRADHKVTEGASTVGLRWDVEVASDEGPVLGPDRPAGVELLRLRASEQPLAELHRRLTPMLRGDHHAITLVSAVQVRELSRSGKPTRRFRPLFACPPIYLRSLKHREIRPRQGLPQVIQALASSAPIAGDRQVLLKVRPRRTDEEQREYLAREKWMATVGKDASDAWKALEAAGERRREEAVKETAEEMEARVQAEVDAVYRERAARRRKRIAPAK